MFLLKWSDPESRSASTFLDRRSWSEVRESGSHQKVCRRQEVTRTRTWFCPERFGDETFWRSSSLLLRSHFSLSHDSLNQTFLWKEIFTLPKVSPLTRICSECYLEHFSTPTLKLFWLHHLYVRSCNICIYLWENCENTGGEISLEDLKVWKHITVQCSTFITPPGGFTVLQVPADRCFSISRRD